MPTRLPSRLTAGSLSSPGFDLRVDLWRFLLNLLQIREVLPISPSHHGRAAAIGRETVEARARGREYPHHFIGQRSEKQ